MQTNGDTPCIRSSGVFYRRVLLRRRQHSNYSQNVIDAKWVYTSKVDEHGWVVKAKSRLIARGFKQREGVDFSETFAPLRRVPMSVYCLHVIACEPDLDLCHFDVDQAFIQSHLDEDVFLRLFAERSRCKLAGKVFWTQQKFVRIEASLAYHGMPT